MAISLSDVESRNLDVVSSSLLFTLGVLVGTLFEPAYATVGVIPLIILYSRQFKIAIFLCGLFSYQSFSLCNIYLQFPQIFLGISKNFCDYIDTLPYQYTGLTKAFLQGDKSDLSVEVLQAFRNAGAAHLLALSGLHLGIIYIIFDKVVFIVDRYKYLRFILVCGFTLVFTLMTGAGPSIVRAFLFITINEIARLAGTKTRLYEVLCLALLIQLFINPLSIYSVGFQLSYSAVAGITILYPWLRNCYQDGSRILKKVWNAMSLAISCQMFTTPISYICFGTFPRYFLLANLLGIPLTIIFMVCSIVVIGLSAISLCPAFLYSITDLFGTLLMFVLEVISKL